ncbi:MAG: hypothetical protein FK733_14175 [Asgard group archaeon]|nr:hypothetical protein [Asgard group archaeon]
MNENQTEIDLSLAKKVDSINEHLFYGVKFSKKVIKEILQLIRERQRTSGDSIGQLAFTDSDIEDGTLLFTGEKLKTNLAIKNILSQEAYRLLTLANGFDSSTDQTIDLATKWLNEACFSTFCFVGECKHSTLAYIRFLNSIKPPKFEEQIRTFLTLLKEHRDNKGRWDGFPFFYTLLVLKEIDLPEVISELCYAIPACEKKMIQMNNSNNYTQRRVDLIHQVYEKCQYDFTQFITSS